MTGKTILHYKILEKIGEGGMGIVYKAEDLKLKREVAIKFLPRQIAARDEERSRFEIEAQAAAALNHPNIATIYAIEEFENELFIVMEYIDGQELKERLDRDPLSLNQTLNISLQIAKGLQVAHEKGVVHRDIKSANIMLTKKHDVKIMDFGLAKIVGDAELNQTQSILGTLAYMSPEQTRGEEVDQRSDIFSFGVLLYEMLTGKLPFQGEYEQAITYSIANEDPEPITSLREDIPPELERIVAKSMAKVPSERYQDVEEMATDLQAVKNSLETGRKEEPSTKVNSSKKLAILLSSVAALVLLFTAIYFSTSSQPIDSIAVLPFVNSDNNQDIEYLSDGLAETLINKLSQLPQLQVMARSTVFHYKGKDMSPLEVGRELGVKAVLAGNIVRRGDILVLQAELVDINNGTQIWGQQYKPTFDDIFTVQDAISAQISKSLHLKLSPTQGSSIGQRPTENTRAYHLYLKGKYNWNMRTAEGFERAINFFQQAVELDSNYALAYAGMAESYMLYSSYEIQKPIESFPLAKRMALKALQLDEKLGEAHTALGYIKMYFDWDWAGAEESFKTAIQYNHNYATAYHLYSDFMVIVGRFDEAILLEKNALQLDPLSLISNVSLGHKHYFARKPDLAIEQLNKVFDIDPDFHYAHTILTRIYIETGDLEKAVKHAKVALGFVNRPKNMHLLAMAYAMVGKEQEALKIAIELEELAKQRPVDAVYIAEIYAYLGELDKAFNFLGKAVEERSNTILWLNPVIWRSDDQRAASPFHKIISTPRFKEITREVGWPQ